MDEAMNDWDPYVDDDDDEIVIRPFPKAYVCAHLHGGPHDGETMMLPWARIEMPALDWSKPDPVVGVYRLEGPWRGGDTARYRYEPLGELEQAA